jgi:hypothetical protein
MNHPDSILDRESRIRRIAEKIDDEIKSDCTDEVYAAYLLGEIVPVITVTLERAKT